MIGRKGQRFAGPSEIIDLPDILEYFNHGPGGLVQYSLLNGMLMIER
jgi:hypothetical protein